MEAGVKFKPGDLVKVKTTEPRGVPIPYGCLYGIFERYIDDVAQVRWWSHSGLELREPHSVPCHFILTPANQPDANELDALMQRWRNLAKELCHVQEMARNACSHAKSCSTSITCEICGKII